MKCPACGYVSSGKIRSTNQNNYYWGVIIRLISEETGQDPQEVHDFLKNEFLFSKIAIKSKNKTTLVIKVKSTTELDTKQWEEFMTKARIWASQKLDIFIPEPNETLDKQ